MDNLRFVLQGIQLWDFLSHKKVSSVSLEFAGKLGIHLEFSCQRSTTNFVWWNNQLSKRVKIAVSCLWSARTGQPCSALPLGTPPVTPSHYSCQINDLSPFRGVWNTLSFAFSQLGSSESFPRTHIFCLSQTLTFSVYHEWWWECCGPGGRWVHEDTCGRNLCLVALRTSWSGCEELCFGCAWYTVKTFVLQFFLVSCWAFYIANWAVLPLMPREAQQAFTQQSLHPWCYTCLEFTLNFLPFSELSAVLGLCRI